MLGVVGDAGIGKSRLVRAVQSRLRTQPHIWLEGAGAPIFDKTPFYAVAQGLRQSLGGPRLSSVDSLRRLERTLGPTGLDVERALPLVADLIGTPTPDLQAPPTVDADERRRRLLAILEEWLLKAALRRPVMVVLEDIHWIDPSTLELLTGIIARAASARLCILYTARPNFRAPWPLG